MKPIYEPKGKAKEYGDYALNIYTGCPHRCYYCFAPSVLRRDREKFHSDIRPRDGIVEATKAQLEREKITGQTIHLCFTCDPYPTGYDTTATREIIRLLKQHGNHVQILTKGDGSRDFDLLDGDDWYGITYDGQYGGVYMPSDRWADIYKAHGYGIKTWCSFEPVIDDDRVLEAKYNEITTAECSKCGDETMYEFFFEENDSNFCPHCGTPMTDEAMEMVMLRLEALYDTSN